MKLRLSLAILSANLFLSFVAHAQPYKACGLQFSISRPDQIPTSVLSREVGFNLRLPALHSRYVQMVAPEAAVEILAENKFVKLESLKTKHRNENIELNQFSGEYNLAEDGRPTFRYITELTHGDRKFVVTDVKMEAAKIYVSENFPDAFLLALFSTPYAAQPTWFLVNTSADRD
jgi:hypothetical protein